MNILDLNTDILNIIGDYVKKDNARRITKERDFNEADMEINYLKNMNMFGKEEIKYILYCKLSKNCYTNDELNEYIFSRNLPFVLPENKWY
jgi:hypothetical protein